MSDDATCRSSDRRARVRHARALSGVDFVDYDPAPAPTLTLHLLGPLPGPLSEAGDLARRFAVEGGRRVTGVRVTRAELGTDEEGEATVALTLDREGDTTTYSVRFVNDRDRDRSRPDGIDPRYDRADFSFRPDCPADLDCASPPEPCRAEPADGPAIDYLSKDYASFRQLLFERLALTLPAQTERHAADVGVALVELLAYVGDQLSYRQDAVATEAYLDTARLRTSVRRHARLVDYRMHDGCNARAWVTLDVDRDVLWRAADLTFYARVEGLPARVTAELVAASGQPTEVFLPVDAGEVLRLRKAHGRIAFYTWGGDECRLPCGATRATLVDAWRAPQERALDLSVGEVLLFEEVVGPDTGRPTDADPSRRHAVRLTRVTPVEDPLGFGKEDGPKPLVEIEWSAEDALPFPLRLSSLAPQNGCEPVEEVSVARGNVVLVDHGRPVAEPLGCVEPADPEPSCDGPRRPSLTETHARPFAPVLGEPWVTCRAPLARREVREGGTARLAPPPASATLRQDPREASPVVALDSGPGAGAACALCGAPPRDDGRRPEGAYARGCDACGVDPDPLGWEARFDLLDSSSDDPHFAVESDDDGRAHLRFGDGTHGRAPGAGTAFTAHYRAGEGPAGNVGAEAIAHVAVRASAVDAYVGVRARNPLPAVGGTAPESADEVRARAPEGLRSRRERAVIADDYAELAQRDRASLQRAAAALRWTGSWYEALVTVDPVADVADVGPLTRAVARDLERCRRIGHDLRVEGARYVPVDLALRVCVEPAFVREHVQRALLEALIGRGSPRGFFHPDRFTFGQAVELSALVAAAQSVPGVVDVEVLRLERTFEGDHGELDAGELTVGHLEVARLDHDPARPENGTVRITMRGGR